LFIDLEGHVSFSVTIREVGSVSVVEVAGKLTSIESGALRGSINRLLQEGRKQIVLSLRGLQYLDSSGIGDLAQAYLSVVKRGGEMKVVGLSERIEEILKITHLYQVLPEFHDEQAALQSFPELRNRKSQIESPDLGNT
jgi:anti-sigma B factor antagonist